jgi:hypothetical protein
MAGIHGRCPVDRQLAPIVMQMHPIAAKIVNVTVKIETIVANVEAIAAKVMTISSIDPVCSQIARASNGIRSRAECPSKLPSARRCGGCESDKALVSHDRLHPDAVRINDAPWNEA